MRYKHIFRLPFSPSVIFSSVGILISVYVMSSYNLRPVLIKCYANNQILNKTASELNSVEQPIYIDILVKEGANKNLR